VRVRQREPVDRFAIESFLARWNSLRGARLGVLEQLLEHPALIAEHGYEQRRYGCSYPQGAAGGW
jgi:hypothetical protein